MQGTEERFLHGAIMNLRTDWPSQLHMGGTMKDNSGMKPDSVVRSETPRAPHAQAQRTVSLQPMFVTNRTTLQEIDNHLATAETRIVVVTIETSNSHGIEVVNHLGSHFRDVRIVLVCEGSTETILSLSFRPGVWACVGRRSSVETLREAIDAVATGQRYVAPELTTATQEQTRNAQSAESRSTIQIESSEETSLTRREKQVLSLIAQGKPRREIAELLNVSPRTIDAYRARLLQKLDLHSSVQLVKYAMSAGMAN